jgi:pilus assembly protein FimV
MHRPRQFSPVIVGLTLLFMAHGALALGWGRAQLSAVLGQPLNFTARLRLDPGDVVAPECVASEVVVGDQRVPADAVRLAVDSGNPDALVMRVSTLSAIDEPVVTVTVAVGCPARMSRRFVLLADPPALAAAPLIAAAAPAVQAERVMALPVAAPAAPAAVVAPAVVTPPPVPASRSEPRRPAPKPAPVAKAPRTPPPAPPAAAAPRLQLDAVEPPVKPGSAEARAIDEALEAVAQAASAARATALAASAAEQRMLALEATVAQLRAESSANRQLAAQMSQRLADAEGSGRWLTPLLLAVAALAALALWLVTRLRSLTEERQRAWQRAAAAEAAAAASARPALPTSQLPLVTSEIMPPSPPPAPAGAAWSRDTPVPPAAQPLHTDVEPAMARTDVLPAYARPDAGAARDVTIEELLDLEQQAEFFIVLGQDDAAIDLLVEHLRSTGGGSPLPYLKLLEIYRRRNERDAYERTRARFNERFNAYAPDWDTDLQDGRSLEDYAGVLPRLQHVWSRPMDAMAELEALLFRKSRGELFDLPAYREVLFLYSLARDLLDHEAADSGFVDLLLPLSDGGEFGSTAPQPYLGAEGDSVFDRLRDDRPTAPVDLDLTQPVTQPGIVDPLLPRLPSR